MDEVTEKVGVTLNLSASEAHALEIFCHRFEARHLIGIADGRKEAAEQMLAGLHKLADALSEAQFFAGGE